MSEQEEKGSALNGRVAELLARRKRIVDSVIGEFERGTTERERTTEGRIKKAAPSATDPPHQTISDGNGSHKLWKQCGNT